MTRLDRALGILLLLSQGRTWSAQRLAERFEVSVRSIYRDVEALQQLGVPVVATRGAGGGFSLMEGFVLPPVNLTRQEAVSLVLGVAILRTLRTMPFRDELETAEGKLLSALPGQVRTVLARARELIGFEHVADDVFHREREPVQDTIESEAVDGFLRAIVDMTTLRLGYASPYREGPERLDVVPLGLLWDRDRWYLVGHAAGDERERLFRADRVTGLEPLKRLEHTPDFDVRALLGRGWLGAAMRRWVAESPEPVVIRVSAEQAERLRRDWYYQHALCRDDEADGSWTLQFAERDPQLVFQLVRWLGEGAELLEPRAWREALRRELVELARVYG
ncbi:MAG: YafY family protein [Deinococcales bacterium]